MREQSLVLFSPSGRRKMENMKLFEHPKVLEFDQRGEGCTHRTISCVCFVSMSNFRWHSRLSVTESFIPFHILSHPSSPLHSNRPRWSKCLTFVARMYPRVLIHCFPTQVRFLLPRQTPVCLQLTPGSIYMP